MLGEREETEHETGPVVRGDIRYVLPDFTVSGNLRWTTAAPDDGRLSGTLGAFYSLPRGTVFGQVYQRTVGNSTGGQVQVTGTTIGLEREINSVSRVGLDFGWANQTSLERTATSPTSPAPTSSASYAYDITEVVSAEVGYSYQSRQEDPVDADSHRVYLLLGRTFETGLEAGARVRRRRAAAAPDYSPRRRICMLRSYGIDANCLPIRSVN